LWNFDRWGHTRARCFESVSRKVSDSQVGIGRLLIVGLGLMGGSLALAARRRGLCREVIGYSRSETTLADAVRLHVVDRIEPHLPTALSELESGDLVVIGVPTQVVPDILAEVQRHAHSAVTLTDVASVKGSVVAAAQRVYGTVPPQFVPGHPIAGSEKSGVGAARADLYEHHEVILTPVAETDALHLARVRNLWTGVGARVSELTPEVHDQVLAATSHLPHMLAFGLVDALAEMARSQEIFRYAAGGFRDFTRIAGSDPVMWRDVFLTNKDAVLDILGRFHEELFVLQRAIRMGDGEHLHAYFTRTREIRRGIIEAGQDTAAPDFGRAAKPGDKA